MRAALCFPALLFAALAQPQATRVVSGIPAPQGFTRTVLAASDFGTYLRRLTLKPDGSLVFLHNGLPKHRQDVHAAVIDMSVGRRDLQQCADAVMRLRAEHLFAAGRQDSIAFDLTNGFRAEWSRWRRGERIRVEGNNCRWVRTSSPDASHQELLRYLEFVSIYAGTLSLARELPSAGDRALRVGDVFLQGGSPGHAMIVVDVARDARGRTAFLLAQSYMPAQEIHIVKNPADAAMSPWFLLRENGTLQTPEWTFRWSDRSRWPEALGILPAMAETGSLIAAPAEERERDPSVRAYPHPYKAWLALSSDPDNTCLQDWEELHRVIWEELGLPFGDTLFIRAFNLNLPDQVNLADHPGMLQAHEHDGIHTWGDFMWAGAKGYHRADAEEALASIRRVGFVPRVWVDHSYFQGNMLHNSRYGSMPVITDMAGHAYPNPSYTLDLVREAGVRYLWDGGMSPIIGQDRPLSQWSQQREREATAFRTGLRLTARKLRAIAGSIESGHCNKAYRIRRFPDGQTFYTFQRHGHWEWADIDGLGRLLSAERMERLAANGGTCIAYTHLGKRRANRDHAEKHIPEGTLDALRRLQERWRRGDIMLSSTARMLDYLVLRDHLQVDHASNTVRFMPDGIAFTQCTRSELQGHRFTITGLRLAGLSVLGTEGPLDHTVEEHRGAGLTITLK